MEIPTHHSCHNYFMGARRAARLLPFGAGGWAFACALCLSCVSAASPLHVVAAVSSALAVAISVAIAAPVAAAVRRRARAVVALALATASHAHGPAARRAGPPPPPRGVPETVSRCCSEAFSWRSAVCCRSSLSDWPRAAPPPSRRHCCGRLGSRSPKTAPWPPP